MRTRLGLVGILLGVSACQDCNPVLEQLPYCEQVSMDVEKGNKAPSDICNGYDDNCDGSIDEECDRDKDNYCATDAKYQDCPTPDRIDGCTGPITEINAANIATFGRYCTGLTLDCNDEDALVNPGATEICDGIDNNCVDGIDESYPEYNSNCTTFPAALDGIGICKGATYVCGSHEAQFNYEPRLFCPEVGPLEEVCNGDDDDCNGIIDDGAAQAEFEQCYHELVHNPDGTTTLLIPDASEREAMRNGVGPCREGISICTTYCPPGNADCVTGIVGGDQECYGAHVPRPEICDGNGIDDNCDGQVDEGFDTDNDTYSLCAYPIPDCDDNDSTVYPGALERICDGIDQDCDGLDDVGTDQDNDTFSPELKCSDPADCNDQRGDIYPGAEEKCDCYDNDCDGAIDEGIAVQEAIDISYGIDCSGSMVEEIGSVQNAYANGEIPSCFSDEIIKMSNTYIADNSSRPVLIRNQVTPEEFSNNFAADIPDATCGGLEPSLDFIAYSACRVQNMSTHPVCIELETYISQYFADPSTGAQRAVWRDEAKKTIVYVGDEEAQSIHNFLSSTGTALTQTVVAELVHLADIRVHLFIDPTFMDTTSRDNYGALVHDLLGNCTGKMYNLNSAVTNGTLTSTYENDVIDSYCNDSPSKDCSGD